MLISVICGEYCYQFLIPLYKVKLVLVGIIYILFFQSVFHFEYLPMRDFLLCLWAGLGGILWFEVMKLIGKFSVGVRRILE